MRGSAKRGDVAIKTSSFSTSSRKILSSSYRSSTGQSLGKKTSTTLGLHVPRLHSMQEVVVPVNSSHSCSRIHAAVPPTVSKGAKEQRHASGCPDRMWTQEKPFHPVPRPRRHISVHTSSSSSIVRLFDVRPLQLCEILMCFVDSMVAAREPTAAQHHRDGGSGASGVSLQCISRSVGRGSGLGSRSASSPTSKSA